VRPHRGPAASSGAAIIGWSEPGSIPALEHNALQLWRIQCGEEGAAPSGLWRTLAARERRKAEAFRNERHGLRYLRAHAGLRRILSFYLSAPPAAIEFRYGPAGKPSVEGGPEFNLTTSADLALVAIRASRPVGIDCEQLHPRRDLPAIARRMFQPAEAALVTSASESERLQVFSSAWTALEARVKADGRGLFRSRTEPPMPALDVVHFAPQTGFVGAVAGPNLPPASEWVCLDLG
jgi:4'-phosphopantetheinyl transferase